MKRQTSPTTSVGNQNHVWLAMALIVLAGFAAYANSFHGDFVWDDIDQVYENRLIRQLWPPGPAMGGTGRLPARPVPYYTFAINYAHGGYTRWGYHLFNLAVHLACGLLLFGIVRRTLNSERLRAKFGQHATGLSLAIALLWVVHPLQTESVTYIYQRMESLFGFFTLGTFYSLIRGVSSSREGRWYGLSVVLCALAMSCKEVGVVVPLVLVWYDRVFLAPSWTALKTRRRSYYAMIATTWVLGLGIIIAQADDYPELRKFRHSPFDYAMTQAGVLVHYLRLVFYPTGLTLDYEWPIAKDFVTQIAPPLAVILTLLGLTVWCMWRHPTLGFAGGWFFVILAPTSSIMPVNDPAVEHRMYLPLAAVIAVIVLALYAGSKRLAERWQLRPIVRRVWAIVPLMAAILVLIMVSLERNKAYASALTMWADVMDKAPHNVRAHTNYARNLLKAKRYEEAAHYAQIAAKMGGPHEPLIAQTIIGLAYIKLGRIDEAQKILMEVLRQSPDNAESHFNLGVALSPSNPDAAFAHFQQTLQLDPGHVKAHNNVGNYLLIHKHPDQAMWHYRMALSIDPDFADAQKNLTVLQEVLRELQQTRQSN